MIIQSLTYELKRRSLKGEESEFERATITKTTKKEYRYEKWYIYHNKSKGTKQRWCYLSKEYLKLPEIQKATQNRVYTNNPDLGSISEIKAHFLPSLGETVVSDKLQTHLYPLTFF